MNNQAAQTMPSIATLPFVTVEQVQRYRAESLRVEAHRNELLNQAAALSQPAKVPALEKWERVSMEMLAAGLRERGDDLSTDSASWLEKWLAAAPAASAKYCSDERPCTPCFSDNGACEDAPAASGEESPSGASVSELDG